MGHSTVNVTEGYLHLVPKDLQRLVDEPDRAAMLKLANGGRRPIQAEKGPGSIAAAGASFRPRGP
jgi:hypothetical protein